jgi:hypothetical protein
MIVWNTRGMDDRKADALCQYMVNSQVHVAALTELNKDTSSLKAAANRLIGIGSYELKVAREAPEKEQLRADLQQVEEVSELVMLHTMGLYDTDITKSKVTLKAGATFVGTTPFNSVTATFNSSSRAAYLGFLVIKSGHAHVAGGPDSVSDVVLDDYHDNPSVVSTFLHPDMKLRSELTTYYKQQNIEHRPPVVQKKPFVGKAVRTTGLDLKRKDAKAEKLALKRGFTLTLDKSMLDRLSLRRPGRCTLTFPGPRKVHLSTFHAAEGGGGQGDFSGQDAKPCNDLWVCSRGKAMGDREILAGDLNASLSGMQLCYGGMVNASIMHSTLDRWTGLVANSLHFAVFELVTRTNQVPTLTGLSDHEPMVVQVQML